jgi:hypothetical protein
MLMCEQASSKQFRIPGQEIWGEWRVKSYDFTELRQPVSHELLNELANSREFQPVGQIISIHNDGVYLTNRSASQLKNDPKPHVVIKVLPPFSDGLCQYERWGFLCKDGTIEQDRVSAPFVSSGFAEVHWKLGPQKHKKKWAGASQVAYHLAGEQFNFHARLLNKNELLVLVGYVDPIRSKNIDPTVYAIWERVALEKSRK